MQSLDESGLRDIAGTWDSSCVSEKPAPGGGDRYARFYTFTLTESADVTITLTSKEDTYLYLLKGFGKNGAIESENDDIAVGSDTNSRIQVTDLQPGDYTIEATTYVAETSGSFSLVVEGLPGHTAARAFSNSITNSLSDIITNSLPDVVAYCFSDTITHTHKRGAPR